MTRTKLQVLCAITICGLIVFLSGCNQAAFIQKLAPADDEARARQYLELLRKGQSGPLIADLDPTVQVVDIGQAFVQMQSAFPDEEPISSKVVGVNIFRNASEYRSSLTLEYQFSKRWVTAEVATRTVDGNTTITSIQTKSLNESLEEESRFRLAGKGVAQYVSLFFALVSACLSISAFILCIRTKGLHKKWLWLVATMIGVGRFAINWNTAGTAFKLIWINAPPFGASSNFYSPWVIFVSIPVGAIAFLIHREGLGKAATPMLVPNQDIPYTPEA